MLWSLTKMVKITSVCSRPRWSRRPLAAALAAPLLVALAGCSRPEPTVAVKRDIVAHMALQATVTAPPGAQAVVYPPYLTTVKRIRVKPNERVAKGQVLMELAIPSADQALQGAKDAVRQAEADYQSARANAAAPVQAAEQRLAQAKAAEKSARAALRQQNPAPDQGNTSDESGATPAPAAASSPELEQAVRERRAAEQAFAQARAQVDAEVLPARQALEEARQALREAQAGRAQGFVRAPITGTVIALNAQEGATVGQDRNQPLATILNRDKLQVRAPLAPEQVPYAKEGTPVKLTSSAWPNQQVEGKIVEVISAADPQGKGTVYTAILGVDDRNAPLAPNQQVLASVKLDAVKDVVAVPNSAIRKGEGGQPVVEVQRNGQWVNVPVQTGLTDNAYTEIKQGIQPGEVVKAEAPMLGRR
jgi:RND family efflux transporter MFP subunit